MNQNGTTKRIKPPKSVAKLNKVAEFGYISSRSFRVFGQTMGEPRVVVKLADAIHIRNMARENAYIEAQRHLSKYLGSRIAGWIMKPLFHD